MLAYRMYRMNVLLELDDCLLIKIDVVTTPETEIQAFLFCFWNMLVEQVNGGSRHSKFGQARRHASS